jgi:opacity protein-like surface antigen
MKQPHFAWSKLGALVAPALLALALCATAPVTAGLGKDSGEIGFDFGAADLETDFLNDVGGGLTFRGGYFFTDLFEIEGQIGAYGATNLYSSDVTVRTLLVDAVFNFRPGKGVMPYVVVGGGVADVDYDRWFDSLPGPSASDSSIAFQAGGGSRFFFGKNKRVAVRLEAAFLREETFDDASTHERLTVGFTWRLGP